MCDLYMLAVEGLESNSKVCVCVWLAEGTLCAVKPLRPMQRERLVLFSPDDLAVATRTTGCMVGFCQSLLGAVYAAHVSGLTPAVVQEVCYGNCEHAARL